jgi:predicted transposase YbfD/YdcC
VHVSIVEHGTGVSLGEVKAETKGREIAAFAAVLDRIDLTGVVVTADSLHTQLVRTGVSSTQTVNAITSLRPDTWFRAGPLPVRTGDAPRVMATWSKHHRPNPAASLSSAWSGRQDPRSGVTRTAQAQGSPKNRHRPWASPRTRTVSGSTASSPGSYS